MYIFALDSSGKAASAAIISEGRVISYEYLDLGLTHSQTLMPLCDCVFTAAGLKPDDMGCFAATIGPGSFTGLRIGISIIKGMALALDKPCVGVPVNDALALSAEGFSGVAITVSDARAGRVFAAAYDMSLPWPRRLCEDTTLEIERLTELMPDKNASYIFVGDAASLCYNAHKENYSELRAITLSPNAFCAVRCAERMVKEGLAADCRELTPRYLQPSQAERNFKG